MKTGFASDIVKNRRVWIVNGEVNIAQVQGA